MSSTILTHPTPRQVFTQHFLWALILLGLEIKLVTERDMGLTV